MKMRRILAVLLIATFILSTPALAVDTSDLLIQEEVYTWGTLDIMKITNFTKYLDKEDYVNAIYPEEYGYAEGTDIITHCIEVYGSTTISTSDPSAYVAIYRLKELDGKLRFDVVLDTIEGDMFYDSESGEPPVIGDPVTLTEPGYYLIYKQYDAFDLTYVFVKLVASEEEPVAVTEEEVVEEAVEEEAVEEEAAEEPAEVVLAKEATAKPTTSNVLVDGVEVNFEAYNINDNNYFKLRDLAYILSKTANQFEVEWDAVNKVINLVRGQEYTPVGGEMEISEDLAEINASLNESKIFVDGEEIYLAAYTIDGNNYFKLRDVGQVMGFEVTWDSETKTIGINTSIE